MIKPILSFLGISVFFVIHFIFVQQYEIEQEPGVLAPNAPIQVNLTPPQVFQFKKYEISALAEFDLTGRILSKCNYIFGTESALSPVDLAMGWKSMSDSSVLDKIEISQSGRRYRWAVREFPISRRDIETCSANMHMIPSSSAVEADLQRLRKGQVIRLKGKLVSINANGKWFWRSSTTREDTGNNSCEVIWVESIQVLDPENRRSDNQWTLAD
jgi:hypothetical protein